MESTPPSYKGHRYPAEIIAHCVWLYFRFPLSFRDVEELMFQRGVIVSHETIRRWSLKFGQGYADGLRRCRPAAGDKWHLDEVFVKINGERQYLWRAVDQHGTVLGIFVYGDLTPAPTTPRHAVRRSHARQRDNASILEPLLCPQQVDELAPQVAMPYRRSMAEPPLPLFGAPRRVGHRRYGARMAGFRCLHCPAASLHRPTALIPPPFAPARQGGAHLG